MFMELGFELQSTDDRWVLFEDKSFRYNSKWYCKGENLWMWIQKEYPPSAWKRPELHLSHHPCVDPLRNFDEFGYYLEETPDLEWFTVCSHYDEYGLCTERFRIHDHGVRVPDSVCYSLEDLAAWIKRTARGWVYRPKTSKFGKPGEWVNRKERMFIRMEYLDKHAHDLPPVRDLTQMLGVL